MAELTAVAYHNTAAAGPRPSQPPKERFSISNFISRMRPKRSSKHAESREQSINSKPPLNWAPLPLVLPDHQPLLSNLGWTPVTFPHSQIPLEPDNTTPTEDISSAPGAHPLQTAYEDLFAASQKFFDLPIEEKGKWVIDTDTEEGWFHVPGEKEFITLRTMENTPEVLKSAAKTYWDLMGVYLDTCLGRISTSLGLPDSEEEGLRRYVGPCKVLGEGKEERRGALLRLFRYEGWEEKVVAEPHSDLGLLSFVVGNVPGLEVWNGRGFVDIERRYLYEKKTCGTLLCGRQLERLSNWRYPAGGHRVVSYGAPSGMGINLESRTTEDNTVGETAVEQPKYRFSIVFVLRAHHPIIVDTDTLTTPITGQWERPIKEIEVKKWYEEIRGAHYNINTSKDKRDDQRQKIQQRNQVGGQRDAT